MKYGTLYGIGVGPGDPELITLKALNTLGRVAVVFAAASSGNKYSLAVEIASPHLKEGVPVVHLGFPMTRDTRRSLPTHGRKMAEKVAEALKNGKDAAFITLGDPLTYSTFGYILENIREMHPEIPIKIIPGDHVLPGRRRRCRPYPGGRRRVSGGRLRGTGDRETETGHRSRRYHGDSQSLPQLQRDPGRVG